eukprot:3933915-Rhodomonas_salina.1
MHTHDRQREIERDGDGGGRLRGKNAYLDSMHKEAIQVEDPAGSSPHASCSWAPSARASLTASTREDGGDKVVGFSLCQGQARSM